VEGILEKANLRDLADKHARKLSGGEAQRVALARSLVLDTPILLLDEPTNSLDDASQPVLHTMLREAHTRGTTIVIASHDSDIVSSLNPRVVRMEKGKIAE
jgi:ABC-type sulfate/molybdate transport systems ATPase subunit